MMRKKRISNNRAMRKVVKTKTTNSKKMELLSVIDEKLEAIGLDYGPIVYDELQSRLEKTVDAFNKDLDFLFSENFPTYKLGNKKNTKSKGANKPKYISDYEKSKKD